MSISASKYYLRTASIKRSSLLMLKDLFYNKTLNNTNSINKLYEENQ